MMVTYTFFELNDLKKFYKICSYEFKYKLNQLLDFDEKSNTIQNQKELTEYINKMGSSYVHELNKDLISSIKSKEETIERLRQEIFLLENVKEKIKDSTSFNKVFEIISKL